MLTAKEFAEEAGISYPVVIVWLRDGKIPEAEQTSFKIWQIPAEVAEAFNKPENRPKRGRPLKITADNEKDQAGKEAAAVKEMPAKPKERAVKKARSTSKTTRSAKKGNLAK